MRRLNNRTHRKLLIADGTVGMTGGVGIAEEWTGDAQDPDHWRDTHVRVRGPVVRGLQGAFAENWLEATGDVLVGAAATCPSWSRSRRRRRDAGRALARRGRRHERRGALLPRDRLRAASARPHGGVLRAAAGVHRGAVRRGRARRRASASSSRAAHIDKGFVRHGRARAPTRQLLRLRRADLGVRPDDAARQDAVVDGAWSSVGSVNFDNRSFQLHDEVTLCVCSRAFADELDAQFERDLEVSEEIDPERWRRRLAARAARPKRSRASPGASSDGAGR